MNSKDVKDSTRRLRIFIAYAREDSDEVLKLYRRLQDDGFQPWMDKEDLIPGQRWQSAIRKAVQQSDVFLVCISRHSVTKTGFVNREIYFALGTAGEQPEDSTFMIPVRLEDTSVPERLSEWQWCNLFDKHGYDTLLRALRLRAEQIGVSPFVSSVESQPIDLHQTQSFLFSYESGLDILRERLRSNSPYYISFLTYEQRLRENISQVRRFGDTETRRIERANIIVELNKLAHATLNVSFNDLCFLGIGALEPEQVRQEWEQQIRSQLLLYGEVTPEELRKIPPDYREQALRRFAETYQTTLALEDYKANRLRLLNSDVLRRWHDSWNNTAQALCTNSGIAQEGREAVNKLAGILSEVLGFSISQFCNFHATRACMVEAPALRLKLPPCFPLVFVADPNPGAHTVQMLVDAIDVMRETGYFALVVPLEPAIPELDTAAQLRQAIAQSPHVQDFIVLSQNQIHDILIARNPTQALAQQIVGQVDLSVISPFVISGPVPETMFFGRDAEVRLLFENAGKTDFALVGNRKIGKTSLLQRTRRRLDTSGQVHALYINCQTVRQATDFFTAFQEATGLEQPPATPKAFAAIMHDMQRSGKPPVLLIDEVDKLLDDDYAQGEPLAAEWRALAQDGVCRFVFCGSTGLARCLDNPHSVFFNFPQSLPLGYLNAETARMVLTQPLQTLGVELEDEHAIVDEMLNLTSGHPNLVQYIGRELVNAANVRRERLILVADLDEVKRSHTFTDHYFNTIWGESGPLEKLITLVAPSEGFRVGEIETALERYGVTPAHADMDRALKMLCMYSVLERKDKTYSFVPRSFPDILHRTQEVERLIAIEKEQLER